MINAVVFDLGGTLIEYAGEWTAWPDLETPGFMAAYGYLQEQGVELPPFATFQAAGFAMLPQRWRGATRGERNLRLAELLAEVTAVCTPTPVSSAHLFQASKRYEQAISNQAHLMPHAHETLLTLKQQGYKLGLLSNTMFTGEGHISDLRRYGLLDYFDALLFSADVGKWKPNPEPFHHILADLGVEEATTAVYVGDDPASDVVGGRSVGMWTVFCVGNGRFPHPSHITPHATIPTLATLPTTLKTLTNHHE